MKLPKGIREIKRIILSEKTGDWCQIPYPGHPKGCPNYNYYKTADRCPPRAPHITTVMYFKQPIYIVYSEFDLESDIERRKKNWPTATEKQLRCVLYWQETSRKQMRDRVKIAKYMTGANVSTSCPEGMGVNVYATCLKNGLKLEKIRHLKICHHVALVGYKPNQPLQATCSAGP